MYRPSFKSVLGLALGLAIGVVAIQTASAQGYRRQMPTRLPAARSGSPRPTPSQPNSTGLTILPTFQGGYLGGMAGMVPGRVYYPPVPPPMLPGLDGPLPPPIGLDYPTGPIPGLPDLIDPSLSSLGGTGDGAGSYLQGAADVIRSQGQYLVSAGQAGLVGEQTAKARIENRRLTLDQWLYEREMKGRVREQDEYREAAARRQQAAVAQESPTATRAERQAPPSWPLPLLRPEFKASRERFAAAVAKVSGANSGRMDRESYKALSGAVEDLRAEVKNHINDMTPGQYLESKRFVGRLAETVEGLRVATARQVRTAE